MPRAHPVTVHVELERVLREVEVEALVLLAYHVHVCLQEYLGPVLIAGSGRHLYGEVPAVVLLDFKAALAGESHQIVAYGLLVKTAPWYAAYLLEPVEYLLRLYACQRSFHNRCPPSVSERVFRALLSVYQRRVIDRQHAVLLLYEQAYLGAAEDNALRSALLQLLYLAHIVFP